MKLTSGTTLRGGKYTIVEPIGQGTFGITYLAIVKLKIKGDLGEIEVPTKVAIKEFFMEDINYRVKGNPEVKGSTGSIFKNYLAKFQKEAKHLADLHHPNIVQVLEVFDENNTSYYVMEYIEGKNLDACVSEKTRFKEEEGLKIIHEIGEALHYMHSKKLLHLDVKPSNVMVDADGKCTLIDFGLSKQYTDDGVPESSTKVGYGTPGYAPLEQSHFKQDGSFPATLDIYALGSTLYKMLTGKRAPQASVVLNEGLDTGLLKEAGVSDDTINAILKAMNPSKKMRYQTILDFMAALPSIKNDVSIKVNSNDSNKEDNVDEDTTIYEDTVVETGDEETTIDEETKFDESTSLVSENTEIDTDFDYPRDDDVVILSEEEAKKLHEEVKKHLKGTSSKKENPKRKRLIFYSIILIVAFIIGYFSSKYDGTENPATVSEPSTEAVTEEIWVDTVPVVELVEEVVTDSAI